MSLDDTFFDVRDQKQFTVPGSIAGLAEMIRVLIANSFHTTLQYFRTIPCYNGESTTKYDETYRKSCSRDS